MIKFISLRLFLTLCIQTYTLVINKINVYICIQRGFEMRKDKFMKEGHHRGERHKGRDGAHHRGPKHFGGRAIAFRNDEFETSDN